MGGNVRFSSNTGGSVDVSEFLKVSGGLSTSLKPVEDNLGGTSSLYLTKKGASSLMSFGSASASDLVGLTHYVGNDGIGRTTKNSSAVTLEQLNYLGQIFRNRPTPTSTLNGMVNTGDGGFSGGVNAFLGSANGTFHAHNQTTNSPDIVNYQVLGIPIFKIDGAGNVYGTANFRLFGSGRIIFAPSGTERVRFEGTQSIFQDNGVTTASANSLMQLNSTTKGFAPPRMTTAQRLAIPVTAADYGLIVTDTTIGANYQYTLATGWAAM